MYDSTRHRRPALRNAAPTLSALDCHARKSTIYTGETTVPLHLPAAPSHDSHGLHDHIDRWYDPTVGRWLSEDPLGFEAGDGNLYRYVDNTPTVLIDPEGLQREEPSEEDLRDKLYKERIGGVSQQVGALQIGDRTGTIWIHRNIKYTFVGRNGIRETRPNYFQIELRLDEDDKKCILGCHWLQFARSFLKKSDGSPESGYARSTSGWVKWNEWHLDARPEPYAKQRGRDFSIYYDIAYRSNTTSSELSIFDKPTLGYIPPGERDEYAAGGTDLETYLVCDDKIRFVVKWGIRYKVLQPDDRIGFGYAIKETKPTTQLSDALNTAVWQLPDVKTKGGDYIEQTYDNPWYED